MSIVIREERTGDETDIYALHAKAFPTESEARLVDALRSAGRLVVSLIAVDADRIVGHIGFSPVSVDEHCNVTSGVGLAPVAVHTSHRRQGVAAELIRNGIEHCRDRNVGWMVVLGDPAHYARFGFQSASRFGLTDAYGGGNAFQALELRTNAMPIGAGLVRYAPEFADLEE